MKMSNDLEGWRGKSGAISSGLGGRQPPKPVNTSVSTAVT